MALSINVFSFRYFVHVAEKMSLVRPLETTQILEKRKKKKKSSSLVQSDFL